MVDAVSVCGNISIFVSPYGRWLFNTVVNDVYQYNVMIVIDDTLSKINDCHRMLAVRVCAWFCVNAMDWKSGNSIPIVSCTTQNKRTHLPTHTLYLTHYAQVDFMCFFLWTGLGRHLCAFIDGNHSV